MVGVLRQQRLGIEGPLGPPMPKIQLISALFCGTHSGRKGCYGWAAFAAAAAVITGGGGSMVHKGAAYAAAFV